MAVRAAQDDGRGWGGGVARATCLSTFRPCPPPSARHLGMRARFGSTALSPPSRTPLLPSAWHGAGGDASRAAPSSRVLGAWPNGPPAWRQRRLWRRGVRVPSSVPPRPARYRVRPFCGLSFPARSIGLAAGGRAGDGSDEVVVCPPCSEGIAEWNGERNRQVCTVWRV